MRGKKAKAVRKMLSQFSLNLEETTSYLGNIKPAKQRPTGKLNADGTLQMESYNPLTITLNPDCERYEYKQLKKLAYRALQGLLSSYNAR